MCIGAGFSPCDVLGCATLARLFWYHITKDDAGAEATTPTAKATNTLSDHVRYLVAAWVLPQLHGTIHASQTLL